MISSIAFKYARALAEVASEKGTVERVYNQLVEFNHLLNSHRQLRETLVNPALPFSPKRKIVEQLALRIPLDPLVVNFLLVLLENARVGEFDRFVSAFGEVLDQRRGVLRGEVYASQELVQSVTVRLEEAVSQITTKQVKLACHQDESLIGGLKLQVGSMVFDASIQAQLDRMRRRLTDR